MTPEQKVRIAIITGERTGRTWQLNEPEIVAELHEQNTQVELLGGEVGIEFYTDQDRQIRTVVMTPGEEHILRGRKNDKEQRSIHLDGEGYGSQQIAPNTFMVVDLGRRIDPAVVTLRRERQVSAGMASSRMRSRWYPAEVTNSRTDRLKGGE